VIGEDFITGEAGEEVATLGGYLVSQVGRLPVRGEVISGPGNYEIEVPTPDPRGSNGCALRSERNVPPPAPASPRSSTRPQRAAGQ